MTLLDRSQITRLARNGKGPQVSLFMPTHRAGRDVAQDPVRFKNLVTRSETELEAAGYPSRIVAETQAPARALLDDEFFWQHASDGLAVLLAPGQEHVFRLPATQEELVVVGERAHLKPLLSALVGDGAFHVLALSQSSVRLFEATRDGIREIDLQDVPSRAYLNRLQNLADEKPMVLGEYGIDSIRSHGEKEQAELVAMHLEEVFRCGLSGTCVFCYTDEWFTGGHAITDWAFGLVRQDRTEKPAFQEVAKVYRGDPRPPLSRYPKVSVVVCSYNGGRTLDGCLRSLQKVDYPDYEVLLVNDGSTDDVPDIAERYEPWLRVFHQENQGLSVEVRGQLGRGHHQPGLVRDAQQRPWKAPADWKR